MKNSTLALMNYPEKNRMVLRLYWICTVCVTCLQILYFVCFYVTGGFTDESISTAGYIRLYIAIPSAIYTVLGTLLTLILRGYGKSAPVAVAGCMIAGSVIFVNVVSYTHYGIAVIFASYIFPIVLSLFYNNRALTLAASFFSLASYVLIAAAYLPTRNPLYVRHNVTDMAAMPVILILVTLSGMRILDIYSDLLDKIIEQTIKKIELEREVKEDSLTKLFNHAVFYESLEAAINRFQESVTPLCVIVMDIDNFKAVNDTYGHAFGDLALLNFADITRSHLSEYDTAYRYGGEEFAIISFRPLDEAVCLADKIRVDFSKSSLSEHPEARFAVSVGVSAYSTVYTSKRDFFESADRALYNAKKQGKNQTVTAPCIISNKP